MRAAEALSLHLINEALPRSQVLAPVLSRLQRKHRLTTPTSWHSGAGCTTEREAGPRPKPSPRPAGAAGRARRRGTQRAPRGRPVICIRAE